MGSYIFKIAIYYVIPQTKFAVVVDEYVVHLISYSKCNKIKSNKTNNIQKIIIFLFSNVVKHRN